MLLDVRLSYLFLLYSIWVFFITLQVSTYLLLLKKKILFKLIAGEKKIIQLMFQCRNMYVIHTFHLFNSCGMLLNYSYWYASMLHPHPRYHFCVFTLLRLHKRTSARKEGDWECLGSLFMYTNSQK